MGRRDGFVDKPKFSTRSEMLASRKREMLPDPTFDVDGDGMVGARDMYMSNRFDVNRDGVLQPDELHELRVGMVQDIISKYKSLPNAHDAGLDAVVAWFGEGAQLDQQVDHQNFARQYDSLCNQMNHMYSQQSTGTHACLTYDDALGSAKRLVDSLSVSLGQEKTPFLPSVDQLSARVQSVEAENQRLREKDSAREEQAREIQEQIAAVREQLQMLRATGADAGLAE